MAVSISGQHPKFSEGYQKLARFVSDALDVPLWLVEVDGLDCLVNGIRYDVDGLVELLAT